MAALFDEPADLGLAELAFGSRRIVDQIGVAYVALKTKTWVGRQMEDV